MKIPRYKNFKKRKNYSNRIKVEFASKDKKFNKTYGSNSCQFYHILVNGTSDAVNSETIVLHGVSYFVSNCLIHIHEYL